MDSPIVAHIKQNTRSCNYWLYIAKTNPLWGQLNRDLIRYIYWMIFERHPAQIWHDRVFDEIISRSLSERRIWRLRIPRGYGKTYMTKRLREYYDTITDMRKHRIHIRDEHSKLDWEIRGGVIVIITCSSKFYNMETQRNGVLVEYRELKI